MRARDAPLLLQRDVKRAQSLARDFLKRGNAVPGNGDLRPVLLEQFTGELLVDRMILDEQDAHAVQRGAYAGSATASFIDRLRCGRGVAKRGQRRISR